MKISRREFMACGAAFNCWGKKGEPIASDWMKFANS